MAKDRLKVELQTPKNGPKRGLESRIQAVWAIRRGRDRNCR
jgi:hypothetical protein